MTFYKIIQDNKVIDVNNKFFRYQKKYFNIISSSPENAQLIQSSDGKEFYSTGWLKPLPEGISKKVVDAYIISEEEYNELNQQLQVSEEVFEVVQEDVALINDEPQIVEQPVEQVMNIRELYEKLQLLEKELQSLRK